MEKQTVAKTIKPVAPYDSVCSGQHGLNNFHYLKSSQGGEAVRDMHFH